MASALRLEGADAAVTAAPARLVEVRFTNRADGDMLGHAGDPARGAAAGGPGGGPGVPPGDPAVASRRRLVVDRPWTWLRQVHGSRVIVVDGPGAGAGAVADASVSNAPGTALAILTADCAPIALVSPEGVIGAAHGGWRGLLAGVVAETVAAMRSLGATRVTAALGPCIHPECYRFAGPELGQLVRRFGAEVRSSDRSGEPALDVPATVRAALDQAGATLVSDARVCTACSSEHWSWRARAERERQAMVVWCP